MQPPHHSSSCSQPAAFGALCWSFIRHISVMGVALTSDPLDRGQMMGHYNGISRLGGVTGIVLGGILFDWIGFTNTMTVFCVG
ncbi:MAG: hypothetical protein CMQ19_06825 [Gammaproteobacteria bacterium]|nr:hypothetical protein [Gammaproteobacteria bacterium]